MSRRSLFPILAGLAVLLPFLAGCSMDPSAVKVGDFKITAVTPVTATSTTNTALTGLTVYIQDGTATTFTVDVARTVNTYTFTGLLPGNTVSLRVKAVYPEGTYKDVSFTDYTAMGNFTGGPWYDGSGIAAPHVDGGFGVGSFNKADSVPSGAFDLSDFYYFNPSNTEHLFSAAGEVLWLEVNVNQVTADNDTTSQRNNVQWLSRSLYLLDAKVSGLSTYAGMADVKVEVVTVTGTTLLTVSGTSVSATMTATNFSTLLSSVDSGYYADRTGVFYIKATCESMPASYSTTNTSKRGSWGLAMPGARR